MGARKVWIRGPFGGYKYRLNERCPLFIDEIVWDKGIVFRESSPISRAEEVTPRRFNNATRQAVWDKTGGKCWYCQEILKPWQSFSIDHVIPRSKGGTDELCNLVPCCRHCNSVKKNRPAEIMYER
jgi:hypothetical protein